MNERLIRELYDRANEIDLTNPQRLMANRAAWVKLAGAFRSFAAEKLELSDSESAERYLAKALELFRNLGDSSGEASILRYYGWMHCKADRFDAAIQSYRQALAIDVEVENPSGEADDLAQLGQVFRMLGDFEEAILCFKSQHAIGVRRCDLMVQASALAALGWVFQLQGRVEDAREQSNRAIQLADQVGRNDILGRGVWTLAECATHAGNRRDAIEFYDRAIAALRQSTSRSIECCCLHWYGRTLLDFDEPLSGRTVLSEALSLARRLGDRGLEAATILQLGRSYDLADELYDAIAYYSEAACLFRDIKDPPGEGRCHSAIGSAYESIGLVDAAMQHHQQAIDNFREGGDRRSEAIALSDLASVVTEFGAAERGDELIAEACEIASELKDPELDATIRESREAP